MTHVAESLVTRAQRRAAVAVTLRGAGIGAVAGAVAGLLMVLVAALLGWLTGSNSAASMLTSAAPVAVGVGALLGALNSVRRWPTRLDVAVRLDRALGLRDRLGTAESLRSQRGPGGSGRTGIAVDDAVATLVMADADRRAGGIAPSLAMTSRGGTWWVAAVIAGFAVVGAARWLPSSVPVTTEDQAAALADELASTRRAADAARDAAEIVRSLRDRPDGLGDRAADPLAALEALTAQLDGDAELSPEVDEARELAAAELSELSDELREQAQREQSALAEQAARFSQLVSNEPAPVDLSSFTEALREGRLDDAAAALNDLLGKSPSMPPSERAAIADFFDNLAAAAATQDAASPDDATRADVARADAADGLDESTGATDPRPSADQVPAGDSPEEDRPAIGDDPPTPPDVESPLDDRPNPAGQAEQTEQAETAEQPDASGSTAGTPPTPDESKDNERALPEALRDFAQRLRDETPEPSATRPQDGQRESGQSGEPQSQESQTGEREAGGDPTGDHAAAAEANEPGRTAEEGGAPGTAQRGQAGDESGGQAGNRSEGQTGNERGDQTREESAGERTGANRQTASDAAEDGAAREAGGDRGRESSRQPADEGAADQARHEGADADAGERGAEQVGASDEQGDADAAQRSAGDPSQQPGGEDASAPLERLLRSVAEGQRSAGERVEESRRLREQAERLLGDLSPDQRQRMRRWSELAQREQRSQPGGVGNDGLQGVSGDRAETDSARQPRTVTDGESTDIDLTGAGGPATVLAELLGDREGGGGSSALPGPAVDRIREATERAVEPGEVPARYHRLLRRYFGRIEQTADDARGQSSGGTP